jgi:hypothetical protein
MSTSVGVTQRVSLKSERLSPKSTLYFTRMIPRPASRFTHSLYSHRLARLGERSSDHRVIAV